VPRQLSLDETAAPLVPERPSLDELRKAATACTACDLHKTGTQTVFGEGSEGAEAMFVGEQPGDQEDKAGKPFVGPAGQLFDQALEEAGIDRRGVYVGTEYLSPTRAMLTFNLPPKLPLVKGDRDKILMALHNLVGNALKYTPKGGSVTVNVQVDSKQLLFSVSDTGIGISDEDAERIFERFYRAKDPRVEKITGTGLGLTLAREVVRLHGGEITLKSELNKGSTFTLTLPVSAEAA